MDPMSLNNAIPIVTQADLHLGARPTVRSRESSPNRTGRGPVERGEGQSSPSPASPTTASTLKAEETHNYPPPNPNGHTTNVQLPNPFSSGGAAIVEPAPGRSKERSSLTQRVGNFFRSKSKSHSRSRSRSPVSEGTLHPTIIA